MSMAQRYAGYLEREAFKAPTPVKAEAMRQAAWKLRELDKDNGELRETVDYLADGMRDVFPVAHRLALELECMLLSSKETAAVSKWWDSAHEALEQWREFCREDGKVGADTTAGLAPNLSSPTPPVA
ncbi:MAG: hypothetical protein KJ787_13985 [Gammaproteobacteria bacterium]|nr:hypothetical protein [Gammaproteobacteria bacterium]MBU1647437.1 hypothetical protein [Gammaproteobacteria bacterium]MBU1973229.1 hypothetical protein [Gammaproteobacteria bacterium]